MYRDGIKGLDLSVGRSLKVGSSNLCPMPKLLVPGRLW